jgi:hypothetical protein
MGPVLKLDKTGVTKTNVVVMVDQSLSMGIKDRRFKTHDIIRAKKAIGEAEWETELPDINATEAKVTSVSRLKMVEGVLANEKVNLFSRLKQKFRLHTYLFADTIEPYKKDKPEKEKEIQEEEKDETKQKKALEPSGVSTGVGKCMRKVMEDFRGQPIGGIIIFTDGGSNTGEDPMMTAEFAKNISNPVFPVGVGLPEARDVQVSYIFTDDVVLTEDKVPVYVKVRASGYTPDEISSLTIALGGEEMTSKDINLKEGEQTMLMYFTPTKSGEYSLTVTAKPREDELLLTNNEREKKIRVINKKIKVLMLEDEPQWEFRFLKNTLIRDTRVDVKIFLAGADEDYAEDNERYLKELPKEKKDLFEYDVIILGNLDKEQISLTMLDYIKEFVSEERGGLIVLSDRVNTPWTYKDTPIEDMIPVEFEEQPKEDPESEVLQPDTKEFTIRLTSEGMIHSISRLEMEKDENDEIWQEGSAHFWYAPVIRAKPSSRVLAVHSKERNSYGNIPVLAIMPYGNGQVLWSGLTSFWRWRHKPGVKYVDRLWGQMVQHLSMPHILGGSKRVQLRTDNTEYPIGDKVGVFARVLDKGFSPTVQERVEAQVKGPTDLSFGLAMSSDPSQPGMFRGSFVPSKVGEYKIVLRQEGQKGEVTVNVKMPQAEFSDPEMRIELLQNIAETSGGVFYRIDEIERVFDEIEKKRARITERFENDLWDAPITILLFVLFLGTEVFFRKRSDLA